MKTYKDINSTVGSTPLVRLNTIADGLGAQIFAKLELILWEASRIESVFQ